MKKHNHLKCKTRIIATIGPASCSKSKITRLIKAGVTCFRLNMSHGTHKDHREAFLCIRETAHELQRHIPILCDLCGPKIRVGKLEEGRLELIDGEQVVVTTRQVKGKAGLIPSQYLQLHKDVKSGDRVLMDDGKLELSVVSIDKQEIMCQVVYGGILTDHKGINLPDTDISTSALTAADKKDVLFALEMEADLLALSFVRSANDIKQLKRFILKQGAELLPIVSKIEKPEALSNIDEILEESYAIMVARGDLGVEIPAAQVPIVQKELIDKARCAYKPVIVATQMLESMITSARPTRAEVGDVSTAAINGADAVMLSGETSVGKFPIKAVEYMAEVLRTAEQWQLNNSMLGKMPKAYYEAHKTSKRTVISSAAVNICRDLSLAALILPTRSGYTASIVAAFRPEALSLGLSSDDRICRLITMHWGVVAVKIDEKETHDWRLMSLHVAKNLGLNLKQRTVCVLSGFSNDDSKNEPVLKLLGF